MLGSVRTREGERERGERKRERGREREREREKREEGQTLGQVACPEVGPSYRGISLKRNTHPPRITKGLSRHGLL